MDARRLTLPAYLFIGAAIFIFGAGVAYAAIGARIAKLESDVTDIKSAIVEMRDTARTVTELSVKISLLTAAQEKTSQKVDDIRVMVRN